MNEQQIWGSVLERLHTSIGPALFATWFQGTTALSLQDEVLVVGVATTFAKAHLEVRYSQLICSLLSAITGSPLNIRFVVVHEMRSLNDPFLMQRDSGWREAGTVPFLVVISQEESSYKASVPDVPGCLAVGKTQEEAVQGAREALQAYLEMPRKDRASLPEPHTTAEYIRLPLFFNQEQDSPQTEKDNTSTLLSLSHCSFCGKPQDQIANLTAGPGGVYICHECVDLCREMIEQGTVDFQQLKQALASRKPGALQ